jgi:hypothetical protein
MMAYIFDNPAKKTRKRNVTWFTPPYSAALKTAFGKEFLKLIDKNFPKNHHLHKILNRKTLKLSYSCTPNMYAIINAHNKKILMERTADENSRCNCQGANKANCPVPGECVRGKVVYHAAVKDKNGSTAEYVGCTEPSFKLRYANHKKVSTCQPTRMRLPCLGMCGIRTLIPIPMLLGLSLKGVPCMNPVSVPVICACPKRNL